MDSLLRTSAQITWAGESKRQGGSNLPNSYGAAWHCNSCRSGASDIIAGAVCGPLAFIDALMDNNTGRQGPAIARDRGRKSSQLMRAMSCHPFYPSPTGPFMHLGPTMDPKVAAELLMRLPHLPLRMQV